MRTLTIWLPFLPGRALNSNARVHWAERADAEAELRADTNDRVSTSREVMALEGDSLSCARVSVAWVMANKRPKVLDCPRCFKWAMENQRSNNVQCRCYRPRDAWNAASALKGAIDGLTDAGLWEDDVFEQVRVGDVVKVTVPTLEQEGLLLFIEEVEAVQPDWVERAAAAVLQEVEA